MGYYILSFFGPGDISYVMSVIIYSMTENLCELSLPTYKEKTSNQMSKSALTREHREYVNIPLGLPEKTLLPL